MKVLSLLPALAVAVLLSVSRPLAAQLATPGTAGVAMGQVRIISRDLEAQHRFWSALGGTPRQKGGFDLYQFPGVYVVLVKGEPSGGSIGSAVNHFGFTVKNMAEWLARWQVAGVKIESQARPTQAYLSAPDNIRIEIIEDPEQQEPIRMHHVHFYTEDPLATQAWYARVFDAVPGKRAQFDAADLPGVNLTFSKESQAARTSGRAIDRIGFEVRDLDAFDRKLKGMGISLDRPAQKSAANRAIRTALLTDPWGTQIELSENLAAAAR